LPPTTDRHLDEAAAAWIRAAERGELAGKRARGGGPPAYAASGWNGGPAFNDWNRTRRAPSPADLVEAWRQLAFGCSVLNANAVSRQTLRLFVATGLGQHRPKAYLRGRPLTRAARAYLRSQPAYARGLRGADDIDEVTEHPLLRLVGEVNPDWDHSRLIRYTSLCLDVIGRAHWLPGDERGEPARGRVLAPYLWPLLAQHVLPYREAEGSLVTHYRYFGREYAPGDLVSFRQDSLRDPYALGQSPAQAAFAFVGLSDSYASLMEDLLTQSVRPSVLVTNTDPEEPFGESERRRLQREINYQLSAGGAGRAWVVDGSLDVKTLGVPPTSAAETAISETAVKYVSFIFGVPLSFLRNEDSNRAVAEAGHYQHAKLGVEPRCVNIASTLTKWTHAEGARRGQDWSRLFWAFDNPVKDDEEREARVFDLRLGRGASTINEYRAHLGYGAVPWGDEPWLPGSLTQPSHAAKPGPQSPPRGTPETAPTGADADAEADGADDPGDGVRSVPVRYPGHTRKARRRKPPGGGGHGGNPNHGPDGRFVSGGGSFSAAGRKRPRPRIRPRRRGRNYSATLGRASSNNYKATFFAKYPHLKGKVIVHHAVEQQVLRKFKTGITRSEMHSLENLRGIPKSRNNWLHLSAIRREWNQFYRAHPRPTRDALLKKASEIDVKYGRLFKPPLRIKAMTYFQLEPDVAGGLGENSVVKHGPRPVVTRLHYEFEGWFGDDIVETTPCFIVTKRLAEALKQTGLQGAELRECEISTSDEFEELFPDVELPEFLWLYVFGEAGRDDFGKTADDCLVVSEKILDLLKTFNIDGCEVHEYPPA
jgi:hypothetical protein